MPVEQSFGKFLKQKRLELGLTLRAFCKKHGFNAGNVSKMERGLLPPPQSDANQRRYAEALDIAEGTEDWLTFLDLAAACSGKLPTDVKNDDRIIQSLPLVFRALRDTEADEEKLRKLIETIRKEETMSEQDKTSPTPCNGEIKAQDLSNTVIQSREEE